MKGELTVTQPKTKSSTRTIILPTAVLEILKNYRQNINSRWMFPSPKKEDSPLDPTAVRKKLAIVLERAGCKHVRFHDLRHPYVKYKTKIFLIYLKTEKRTCVVLTRANPRPFLLFYE